MSARVVGGDDSRWASMPHPCGAWAGCVYFCASGWNGIPEGTRAGDICNRMKEEGGATGSAGPTCCAAGACCPAPHGGEKSRRAEAGWSELLLLLLAGSYWASRSHIDDS